MKTIHVSALLLLFGSSLFAEIAIANLEIIKTQTSNESESNTEFVIYRFYHKPIVEKAKSEMELRKLISKLPYMDSACYLYIFSESEISKTDLAFLKLLVESSNKNYELKTNYISTKPNDKQLQKLRNPT